MEDELEQREEAGEEQGLPQGCAGVGRCCDLRVVGVVAEVGRIHVLPDMVVRARRSGTKNYEWNTTAVPLPARLRFRGLQGDEREFGRTEKAHRQLDGADAAVDIELQRTQFEVALDEAPAAGRQHVPRRSNEGQTHLAAVGVAGEQKT